MFSSREIQNRVKSGYIERVGTRLKKMRKQLSDRDWTGLRTEASHLQEGAQNFGYQDIASEVERVLSVLNTRPLSRTAIDTEAKNAMETLFQKLDRFLVDEQRS
jgi:hypothetical protein